MVRGALRSHPCCGTRGSPNCLRAPVSRRETLTESADANTIHRFRLAVWRAFAFVCGEGRSPISTAISFGSVATIPNAVPSRPRRSPTSFGLTGKSIGIGWGGRISFSFWTSVCAAFKVAGGASDRTYIWIPRTRSQKSSIIDPVDGRHFASSSRKCDRVAHTANRSSPGDERTSGLPHTITANRWPVNGLALFTNSFSALLRRSARGLSALRTRAISLALLSIAFAFSWAFPANVMASAACINAIPESVTALAALTEASVALESNEPITPAESSSFLWPYGYATISANTAIAKKQRPIFSNSLSLYLLSEK